MIKIKSKKKFYSGVAGVMTVAIVGTSIYFSGEKVMAKETFQGITDIVEENSEANPFTIVEVTPGKAKMTIDPKDGTDPVTVDLSVGEMGYYIEGAENANFGENLGYFNSTEGRYIYADTLIKADNGAITGGALQSITSYDNDNTLPLYYIPYEEDYNLTDEELKVSGDEIPWKQAEPRDGHEEQIITRKEMVTSLNGRFVRTYAPKDFATTPEDAIRVDVHGWLEQAQVSGNYAGTVVPAQLVYGEGGDFDPNLKSGGDAFRKYNIEFTPNDAQLGYVVSESIRVTAENVAEYPDQTYIYERCYNSEGTMYFKFAGTLSDIKDKLGVDDEETNGVAEDESSDVDGDSEEGEHRRHVRDDAEVEDVAAEEEVDIEGVEGDVDSEESTDSTEGGDSGNDESQDIVTDEPRQFVVSPEVKALEENSSDEGESNDDESNKVEKKKKKKKSKKEEKSAVEGADGASALRRSFGAHDIPSDSEDSEDSLTKFLDDVSDGHEEEESSDDSEFEIMDESDSVSEEVSGVEEEAVDVSGSEDGERVYEEDVIEEELAEDVSGFDETDAEHSGEYFMVRFEYNDKKPAELAYSVAGCKELEDDEASANYYCLAVDLSGSFEAEDVLVPNYAHTGLMKGYDDEQYSDSFVFKTALSKTNSDTGVTTWYGNYVMIKPSDGVGGRYRVMDVTIFYKGVYGNSNWFTQYVFDRDVAYLTSPEGEKLPTMYYYYEEVTADALYSMNMGLLYINSGKGQLLPENSEYVTVTIPETFGYGRTNEEGTVNDLTYEAVFDALQAFSKTDLPIMVDYALTGADYDQTKVQLLAKLLNLDDVNAMAESIKSWSPSELADISFATDDNGYYTMINGDKYSCFQKTPKNHHVDRSIYVYNYSAFPDLMINDKFLAVDPEYNYLNGSGGFDEIYDEIDAENLLRETNAGKSGYAEIPREVNEAVAIKYIISYSGRRAAYVKDETNVLELQPRAVYQDTDDKKAEEGNLYVEEREGGYYLMRVCPGEDAEIFFSKNEINLTSMSTSEFVGMDADLNSKYDLIYIGLSNTHFNVDSSGRTKFNDKDMDGMMYANIGDFYYSSGMYCGALSREWTNWSESAGYTGTNIAYGWGSAIPLRGPGNDISRSKYEALMDFVDGGYPVLVDYNCFYGGDSDYDVYDGKIGDDKGNGYIDNCSQMYKFLHDAADEYGINEKNFFRLTSEGKLSTAVAGHQTATGYTGLFNWYMQLPKPQLDIGENKDETYTNADQHGDEWYFEIPIKIYDDRATDNDETYDIDFYIDRNNDGKFSEIPFPTYKDKGEKVEKGRYSIKREGSDGGEGASGGKFKLKLKKNYTLTFKLDENIHDGPVAYKVVAKLNKPKSSDSYDLESRIANARRDEKIGCYYVDRSDEIKNINVLQVYPDEGCGWYMADTYDGKHTKSMGNNAGGNSADINNWFAGVSEEYKVTFTSISSADFINVMYPDGAFLNDFNVLVLGFKKETCAFFEDAYKNCNPTAQVGDPTGDDLKKKAATFTAERVQEWVESKKSTIIGSNVVTYMTADVLTTSFNNSNGTLALGEGGGSGNASGYNTSKRLRAYAGMDRYGIMERPGWGRPNKGMGVTLAKLGDSTSAGPSLLESLNEYGAIYALKPNSRSSESDDGTLTNQVHGLTYNAVMAGNCGYNSNYSINTNGTWSVRLEGNDDLVAHRLNVGSITMYPNKITRTISISDEVRYPTIQLDLESDDDKDSQPDVTVWLAFSSKDENSGMKLYNNNGWDARNQYYMFTKQNLTYINCAKVPHQVNEQNLWVNAIINTFEAGAGSLSVHIEEPGKDGDGNDTWDDIDTYYLPIETTLADGAEGETVPEDDEIQTIYFNARDFKEGKTTVLANMYYLCPEDKGGEFDVSINDYVKPLDEFAGYSALGGFKIKNYTTALVTATKTDVPVTTTSQDDKGNTVTDTKHYYGYKLDDASTAYRYQMDVPLSLFNAVGDDATEVTIYVKCTSISGGTSGIAQSVINAYDSVKIIKTELFNLD